MTVQQTRTHEDASRHEEMFGRLLVERGHLDQAALDRARRLCAGGDERLPGVIVTLGLAAEGDVAAALAEVLDLPLAGPEDYPEVAPLPDLSARFLREARMVPLEAGPASVVVAVADPLDDFPLQALRLALGRPVAPRVGLPSHIEAAIDRLYEGGRSSLGQLVEELEGGSDEPEDVERLRDLAGEAPVIRLVNLLIARAVELRASDIHLEPFEGRLRVRYRIDGALREAETPPARLAAAIISRVKIMARLDIAERRLPQDGRIRIAVHGREIDLRVATAPTLHGESVVLRILDRGSVALDLERLGLGGETLARYRQALARPNGILLVTGPTGSGKTTTLYASLIELNTADRKILTVEDPVEYRLEGINQIQVKPQIGLDFATVLRALLRHDPDVMMVGEIRDLETAEIAVQAALTGHLVLSTLHTNSAAATVTRLMDMGLAPYLLSATVNGVAAQRLVRRLCPECRLPAPGLARVALEMGAPRPQGGDWRLFRAQGCAACGGSGYRGRTMLVEFLPFTEPVRRLVLRQAGEAELHRAAVAEGMTPLLRDGLAKAVEGTTTLDEVMRVAREE